VQHLYTYHYTHCLAHMTLSVSLSSNLCILYSCTCVCTCTSTRTYLPPHVRLCLPPNMHVRLSKNVHILAPFIGQVTWVFIFIHIYFHNPMYLCSTYHILATSNIYIPRKIRFNIHTYLYFMDSHLPC